MMDNVSLVGSGQKRHFVTKLWEALDGRQSHWLQELAVQASRAFNSRGSGYLQNNPLYVVLSTVSSNLVADTIMFVSSDLCLLLFFSRSILNLISPSPTGARKHASPSMTASCCISQPLISPSWPFWETFNLFWMWCLQRCLPLTVLALPLQCQAHLAQFRHACHEQKFAGNCKATRRPALVEFKEVS